MTCPIPDAAMEAAKRDLHRAIYVLDGDEDYATVKADPEANADLEATVRATLATALPHLVGDLDAELRKLSRQASMAIDDCAEAADEIERLRAALGTIVSLMAAQRNAVSASLTAIARAALDPIA
jgi:hypothetical protein